MTGNQRILFPRVNEIRRIRFVLKQFEHTVRIVAAIGITLSLSLCLFSQPDTREKGSVVAWEKAEKTGFPEFSTVTGENTTAGYYVFAISPYLSILDHWGNPVFYRKISSGVRNFTPGAEGSFSFYDNATQSYHIMNRRFQVIDTLSVTSEYTTDIHDLVLLEDGSSILMGYDLKQIDMSLVVPGGSSDATVRGIVIQKRNPSGEVIFQWESWDHYNILDCDTFFVDLTAKVIDYVHANAITIDTDNHLLLSCRHMSEITKINRLTGEIIWRLGGKRNEFQFIDDPNGFSGQHSPLRLANGNLLLFDNGNSHMPQFSSAKEYQIDEVDKTAKLIRTYRQSPDVFSSVMGNSMPIPNDHILVGWGKNKTGAFLTEFDGGGNACTILSWPNTGIYWSYRVSFMEQLPELFPADSNSIDFGTVALGDSLIKTITITNDAGSVATLYGVSDENNPFFLINPLPIQIRNNDTLALHFCFRPREAGNHASRIYLKFRLDSLNLEDHLVASRVDLIGEAAFHGTVKSDLLKPNISLYPNPFKDDLFIENCYGVSGLTLVSSAGVKMITIRNHQESSVHIKTDRLLPGFYVLELRFRDGSFERRMVIKGK